MLRLIIFHVSHIDDMFFVFFYCEINTTEKTSYKYLDYIITIQKQARWPQS